MNEKRMYEIDIKGCSRCGEDHDKMEFKEFINAQIVGDPENPAYEFNFWGMCPKTNEPSFANIQFDVTLHDENGDIIIDERKEQSEIKKKKNN